jgi:hypothetical protein
MNSPFKITFRKTINKCPNMVLLEKFKLNFEKSLCNDVDIINDFKIVVNNEVFRLKSDLNWNLWAGIDNAEVNIKDTLNDSYYSISYKIDFTKLTLSYLLVITLFLIFAANLFSVNKEVLLTFGIFYLSVMILTHLLVFLRHWLFFNKILSNKNDDLGDYDWTTILKNKNEEELLAIYNGRTLHNDSIRTLAGIELDKRKNLT